MAEVSRETTGDDEGLIRFEQQFAGYCLTGSIKEHALFFGFGPGGNGKGTFVNTLAGVMGMYATTAAMDTFTASYLDKHPTEIAMLHGARMVTASETEEGRTWAENRIKQITGGDPITARFIRQDFFTFKPAFKLMLIGNHKPNLRNVDEAARRRFNIVPFTRTPAVKDLDLEEKLKQEWPAILRWMIDGCLDWRDNGLVRPASVREATDDYFASQDILGQFLAEECLMGKSIAPRRARSTAGGRTSLLPRARSQSLRSFRTEPGSVGLPPRSDLKGAVLPRHRPKAIRTPTTTVTKARLQP